MPSLSRFHLTAWCSCFAAVSSDDMSLRTEAAPHYREGQRLIQLGDHKGARSAFKRAAKLLPYDPRIHGGVGISYQGEGKHKEAIAAYKKALALAPEEEHFRRNLQEMVKLHNLEPYKSDKKDLMMLYKRYIDMNPISEAISGSVCRLSMVPFAWAWQSSLSSHLLDAVERSLRPSESHLNFNEQRLLSYWIPAEKLRPGHPATRYAVELASQLLRPLVPLSQEELVGVEWWPRLQPAVAGRLMHNDRDQSTERHEGVVPAYSSILYMTDVGGPTTIVNQSMGSDGVEKPELPDRGVFSYPKRGLFTLFRGDLMHSVMPPLGRKDRRGERTTLLLNWWRKRPLRPGCEELPPEVGKDFVLKKEHVEQLRRSSIPHIDV